MSNGETLDNNNQPITSQPTRMQRNISMNRYEMSDCRELFLLLIWKNLYVLVPKSTKTILREKFETPMWTSHLILFKSSPTRRYFTIINRLKSQPRLCPRPSRLDRRRSTRRKWTRRDRRSSSRGWKKVTRMTIKIYWAQLLERKPWKRKIHALRNFYLTFRDKSETVEVLNLEIRIET